MSKTKGFQGRGQAPCTCENFYAKQILDRAIRCLNWSLQIASNRIGRAQNRVTRRDLSFMRLHAVGFQAPGFTAQVKPPWALVTGLCVAAPLFQIEWPTKPLSFRCLQCFVDKLFWNIGSSPSFSSFSFTFALLILVCRGVSGR